MSQVVRKKEIRRQRTRRAKVLKLRRKLLKASGSNAEAILKKLLKVSPFYPMDKMKGLPVP